MTTIRENFEKREKSFLSPFGCQSSESKGRIRSEPPCPIRTEFQRDRDRIVYSNAFRRLKHKTQVFLSPLGDHYRTRLTHTLEVSEIARTITRAMRLNEDLAEAIALGHDLGHTPFGHSGETALKEIYNADFTHNEQSLRVVDILENKGNGLNLTHEVRDGILKHSKGFGRIISEDLENRASTIEGRIVRISDIIAYLNHDLDDAIRSGVISVQQIPEECTKTLGHEHSERATTMIKDIIFSSKIENDELCLKMSDEVLSAMISLRKFLYENVYRSMQVHKEFMKAKKILIEIYTYLCDNGNALQKELAAIEMKTVGNHADPTERTVCDFVASMTDRHALALYSKLFFPTPLV
ncbi:MAG: deoxyguanosinetriphosphate triphosphohydrolase [Deltaproteobacteria bacterium]|nr:deoxyguanosinetriphosphate triphosphohydrolase [Deltaproteobacteria bacterium]